VKRALGLALFLLGLVPFFLGLWLLGVRWPVNRGSAAAPAPRLALRPRRPAEVLH